MGTLPKEEAAGAGHPLVAHHDQVGIGLFGDVENGLGGIGLDRVDLNLHPLLLGRGGGGVEDQVDVLARADLVVDVGRSVLPLPLDAPFRHRRVGADDAELGAGELGEVDGLANRLGGGLRAIGPNHDASEHAPPPLLGR